MGGQPNPRRLRVTLHGEESARRFSTAQVGQTALGAISFLALEGDQRFHYAEPLRVYVTCDRRHRASSASSSSPPAPADLLLRFAKYGVDIDLLTRGGGVRLYWLDGHLAHLCVVHLHPVRHRIRRSWRSRLQLCLGIPPSIGYLISALGGHPAGHLRHFRDQPFSGLDAADLGRTEHRCLSIAIVSGSDAAVRSSDWRRVSPGSAKRIERRFQAAIALRRPPHRSPSP